MYGNEYFNLISSWKESDNSFESFIKNRDTAQQVVKQHLQDKINMYKIQKINNVFLSLYIGIDIYVWVLYLLYMTSFA